MKALILAGGLGTRLKSVVQDVPKPMAPIRNRPFLEYLLDFWIEQGITEFYMSTCHLAEKIKSHFKEEYKGKSLHQIQEPMPLGTGGAVLYALDQIKGSEEMVVINGDTFFELDFLKMLQFHKEKKSNLTLGLRQVELNDRYSGIQIDKEGQIELFAKREAHSKNLLINAGVYILKPDLFEEEVFTLGEKYSLEDDIFPRLIKKHSVYGFVATGRFIDIGIPNDYAKAQLFFNS